MTKNFTLMILGRVVDGLGAENMMITQYFTSHTFFENSYLTLAMGLDVSFSLLASVIAFYLLPWIYLKTGSLDKALIAGLIPTFASVVLVLIFVSVYSSDSKVETAIKYINLASQQDKDEADNLASNKSDSIELRNL